MSGLSNTTTREREVEKICWKCGKSFRRDLDVCPDDGSRLLEIASDDRSDPLVGSLFDGRFRIYKKLGEGGMGTVYSARQVDFERDVALKILKVDFIRDENIRKRFMYEARTISNLRHPHAVRLFDFGQAPDGSFYMVMELLEGESLADRLAYRFLTYREIFGIVPPICGVLHEAHENDVVHRDLKPENIFLVDVNHGANEFPKLLDFGIAKHLRDETMTRSGTLWGTPAYMSPEQAKGDQVGAPADIYAIGIILYELISGNLPFHATTQMGLAMKHISVHARPLSSMPGLESVPPELDDLIMRVLHKSPQARPANMQELADQLTAIMKEHFDDELLDSVPAEEIDAIALQDWIADEASIDEDASPVAGAVLPTQTAPAPVIEASTISADASAELEPAEPVSGIWEVAPGRGRSVALLAGAFVIAILAAIGVVTLLQDRPTPSSQAMVPPPQADTARDTSGVAGTSAATAAGVVFRARTVCEAMHNESDMLIVDGTELLDKRDKPAKKRAPATNAGAAVPKPKPAEEMKKIKSALEKTF